MKYALQIFKIFLRFTELDILKKYPVYAIGLDILKKYSFWIKLDILIAELDIIQKYPDRGIGLDI